MDSTLLERGLACTPKTLHSTDIILCLVKKIPYFLEEVKNKAKFHVTVGHQTVIGQAIFFSPKDDSTITPSDGLSFNKSVLSNAAKSVMDIDTKIEYQFVDEIKAAKLTAKKP